MGSANPSPKSSHLLAARSTLCIHDSVFQIKGCQSRVQGSGMSLRNSAYSTVFMIVACIAAGGPLLGGRQGRPTSGR